MDITGKQQFKVATNGDLEISVTFEIDFNHPKATPAINASSRFWPSSPEDDAPFLEHLEYWLKITADQCYYLNMISSFGMDAETLIQAMSKEEGFPPLDGSYGITIKGCNFDRYSFEEFVVTQIESKASK